MRVGTLVTSNSLTLCPPAFLLSSHRVKTHFIVQVQLAALGAYRGVSFALDIYPSTIRVLLEQPGKFSLKTFTSHSIPSDETLRGTWSEFGAGRQLPFKDFVEPLRELVNGMAKIKKPIMWPEKLADLHGRLFGVEVRGTTLGAWETGAFQWKAFECSTVPKQNLIALEKYCVPSAGGHTAPPRIPLL